MKTKQKGVNIKKSSRWRSPWSGRSGAWATWVKNLDGKSGVYIIRESRSHLVLYVGQSHTGRLKKTMIRHFQQWRGVTSGVTYRRGSVEVKIILAPRRRALIHKIEQNCLFKLKPRDNETGSLDEVPF